MTENILFICGSLNQTTMMHKISQQLKGYRCWFTPYYADGIENLAAEMRWLDFTVLGGRHLRNTRYYLAENQLPLDTRGEKHNYDLVVTCSDLIVQRNIRGRKLVLVQEGITEPESFAFQMVRTLKLPRYLANTAATGLSNAFDVFCVASNGYRNLFMEKGVKLERIAVTGIPNFDDIHSFVSNDFPYHDFVLAATSPLRESFRFDDRPVFIRKCLEIAGGRQLIFKLHPSENMMRALFEIREHAPEAMVLMTGNVNHMIANASVVITQQSTCTFVALALNKEVHTHLDVDELHRLMPIQNNGTSAARIARVCLRVLRTPLPYLQDVRKGNRSGYQWEKLDL